MTDLGSNWESIEVRGSETYSECFVDKAGRNFRHSGDYKDNIKRYVGINLSWRQIRIEINNCNFDLT